MLAGSLLWAPAVGLGSGRLQSLCDGSSQGCCRLITSHVKQRAILFCVLVFAAPNSRVDPLSLSITVFRGAVRPQGYLGESLPC